MTPTAEAVDRHPHLAQPAKEGWVRVDMHSHTMWSGDCTTTPDELVPAVAASGLDVLFVTDHNSVAGALAVQASLPCRVIVGEEVRVGRGELIGLFLHERVTPGLGVLDTARAIRDQGGLVYVPHPFDPMRNALHPDEIDQLVAADLIDAFEVRNAKTSLESLNAKARDFAREHDLAQGAGSDAHVPDAFGAAYVTMPDFDGPDSFLAGLRKGQVEGHFFDAPRPWTPRIVPSFEA